MLLRFFYLAIFLLLSGCQSNPTSDQLLANILSSDDSRFDARFYEEKLVTITTDDDRMVRTIKHWSNRIDGKEKYEIVSSDDHYTIFINEDLMTFYKEDTDEAYVKKLAHNPLAESPIRKADVINVLENLRQTHSIKLVKEDNIRDSKAYLFTATPKKDQSLGEVTFWIDQKSWRIVKYVHKYEDKKIESVLTTYEQKSKIPINLYEIPKINEIRFKYDFDDDLFLPITIDEFNNVKKEFLLLNDTNMNLLQVGRQEGPTDGYKLTYGDNHYIHSTLTVKKQEISSVNHLTNIMIFPIPTVGTIVQWTQSNYHYEFLIYNEFLTEMEIHAMIQNFK